MLDIEPAFTPLISVCTEMMTSAGPADNIWVTPAGGLVLGECKLVRNPQARREVVAQALDYARAISSWRYEDLEREVRRALKQPTASIWKLVEHATDLEEHQFTDAVERRLRTGRIMILIIGDGIQEGVEALTEHLQLHAGIHAGMALVDLSIWDDPAGGMLVVPRVPMRTVLVERGIVLADKELGVVIAAPVAAPIRSDSSPTTPRAQTASEPEFYAQLEERRPGLAEKLRGFLESLGSLSVTGEFRASCVLRWNSGPDIEGNAGFIDKGGKVWLSSAATSARRRSVADAGERYLSTLAAEIGGSVRRYDKEQSSEVMDATGHAPDLTLMLDHVDGWRQAIATLIEDSRDAWPNRGE